MYKLSKLKNKINLITMPIKGTKAITVMALFPVGSRYEDSKISGASHFVEHLMFKGTQKRPNALDISSLLESQGADYNAFTGKDYTGYYVKINSAKRELAFDLLSDMIFHSKLDEAEVIREKGVIIEELRMYEDNPTMAIDHLFDQVMYGQNHPLGRDIGGTIQTVKNITRSALFDYYQKYYIPNNMVLVVAGDLSDKKKLSHCLNYFVRETDRQLLNEDLVKNFKKYTWPKKLALTERVAVKEKKLDQAHLILGFPGLKYNDQRMYALNILLHILGVGMNSRLFIEVRERRGLAYMVRTDWNYYRDVGSAQIQAGLDPARLSEALKVIVQEINKIANEKVSARELKDAKSSFVGRMTLAAEDSSVMADWFAKQFWFNDKIKTREEVFRKLKAVTTSEVQKVAKQLFRMDQIRLAVIGDVKKEKIISYIQKYER